MPKTRTSTILVMGSLNLDVAYQVPQVVTCGETQTTFSRRCSSGGKGLNQAVAIARAGAPVRMAGLIGSDGTDLIEYLISSGVDVSDISQVDESTGHAIIQIDQNGDNAILVYGGANFCWTEELQKQVLSNYKKPGILVVQNEINHLAELIPLAHQSGWRIALNPSPINDQLSRVNIDQISWLFVNEKEAIALSQSTTAAPPETWLDFLVKRYRDTTIVLTLGEKGSWWASGDQRWYQPARSVQVVDTTGAGDTFTGYAIAAIAAGYQPPQILHQASVAASLAVTKFGAAPAIPTRAEVATILNNT